MQKKHLLLAFAMLILIELTATAQNVVDKPNTQKDNIPFGKKLPPPDIMNSQTNSSQQIIQPGLNKLLMQAIKTHDKNAIKKVLDDYRQQLKENSNEQALHINGNNANSNSSHTNSNSDFHLTKDINALAESYPNNYSDMYGNISYAILHHVIYFTADDGIHGNELWRSDGTATGTFMIKDIVSGIASSNPHDITGANGKIYFSASTANNGTEPWVSDGTPGGTQLLMDITSDINSSSPTEFVELNKKVYFAADDNDILNVLWKTDGTTAGTKLVKNFGINAEGSYISQLVNANGLLFFTFYSYTTGGFELWRSDGTDAGTYHIGTNATFYNYFPLQLTNYNNKLYFSADDGTGNKLWVSDGTDAGTTPAPGNNDILIYADGTFGTPFPILDNVLYVPGYSASASDALYKYNASNADGVVLVKDLTQTADPNAIVSSEMEVVNNILYFKVANYNDGVLHYELWSSKGTEASTNLINKFQPGEAIQIYSASNTLYFVKNDNFFGTELWAVYNSPFGSFPILVSDIFRGSAGSYPSYLTAFNGKLFFSATDGVKGNELFMTNGLAFGFGASLVKDINTVSTSSSNAGLYIDALTPLGNKVLFNGFEKAYGRELYVSDGTTSGTFLLKDIIPGETGSNPGNMLLKKNFVYFTASSSDTTFSIFKTDDTKQGLQKVAPNINAYQYFLSSFEVADNGIIFYTLFNYSSFTSELWRSDGTSAGTYLLSPYNGNLNVAGNTAFFVASDAVYGNELWKSDGSVAGTKMVKDINPGIANSSPKGMFVYKNEVYFAANNGAGASLWKSDGTKSGTIQLRQIDPWYSSSVFSTERYNFEISNNILYFSAINYANAKGTELWKSDGTKEGTQPVKDVSSDADSYYPIPYYLTDVNGTLFFILQYEGGVNGTELWKSDGTKEGTKLVKDITPGADASGLNNLTGFGGKLYFTNSGVLWSSDGTADGTIPVDDAGISDVYVYNIVAASDQLFLSGSTQQYGTELYAGKVDETGKFVASKSTNENAVKTSLPFSAMLYPNPVVSKATLQLTGDTKNISVSVTDMSGKILWQNNTLNATLIKLPIEKYTSGTYFVTVTNGKESKTIKLVKQ